MPKRARSAHPSTALVKAALSVRPTLQVVRAPGLQQVTFTIDGNTVSGNHNKGFGPGGVYKLKAATNFQSFVKAVALDAKFRAKYQIPDYCRVDVSLYYNRQDRDNACKELMDALEEVVYLNDSHVLDGGIRRVKDWGGEQRVIVTVTEVMPGWYGYPRPKKTDPILSHEDWVRSMLAPYERLLADSELKEAA